MHNKGAIFITSKPYTLLRSHTHYVGAIYITREPYTLLGSYIHNKGAIYTIQCSANQFLKNVNSSL